MASYELDETTRGGHGGGYHGGGGHSGGGMSQVGSRPFNHNQSPDAEREYDRLRDLARQEASKRGQCFEKVL